MKYSNEYEMRYSRKVEKATEQTEVESLNSRLSALEDRFDNLDILEIVASGISDRKGCITLGKLCIEWGTATMVPDISTSFTNMWEGSSIVTLAGNYKSAPSIQATHYGWYESDRECIARDTKKNDSGFWQTNLRCLVQYSTKPTSSRTVQYVAIGVIA